MPKLRERRANVPRRTPLQIGSPNLRCITNLFIRTYWPQRRSVKAKFQEAYHSVCTHPCGRDYSVTVAISFLHQITSQQFGGGRVPPLPHNWPCLASISFNTESSWRFYLIYLAASTCTLANLTSRRTLSCISVRFHCCCRTLAESNLYTRSQDFYSWLTPSEVLLVDHGFPLSLRRRACVIRVN